VKGYAGYESVDPKLHPKMLSLQQKRMEDKLSQKLGRRRTWQELVGQGILLGKPQTPQVVMAKKSLKKQADRERLDLHLRTRPTVGEIVTDRDRKIMEDTMTWHRVCSTGAVPLPRNCHSTVATEEHLFLLGGYGTGETHLELLVLDLETLAWFTPPLAGPAPLQRYSHSCSIVGAKLVLFGGFSFNGYRLNDLSVLDTSRIVRGEEEDSSSQVEWTRINQESQGTPPCARFAHTATVVGDKIYLFGGNDGQNLFNDMHVLDTETWTWSPCHTTGEIPLARAGHAAVLVNDACICFFGGGDIHGPTNDLYIFDVDTHEWTRPRIYGTPPSPRMGHTASSVTKDQLLIFGGGFMDKVYNDMHMFDMASLQWSRPSDTGTVPIPRAGHTACSVGSRIYTFGGGDCDNIFNDLHSLDTAYLNVNHLVDRNGGHEPTHSLGSYPITPPSVLAGRSRSNSLQHSPASDGAALAVDSEECVGGVLGLLAEGQARIERTFAATRARITRSQERDQTRSVEVADFLQSIQQEHREALAELRGDVDQMEVAVLAEVQELAQRVHIHLSAIQEDSSTTATTTTNTITTTTTITSNTANTATTTTKSTTKVNASIAQQPAQPTVAPPSPPSPPRPRAPKSTPAKVKSKALK
jgi:hypothetical protein